MSITFTLPNAPMKSVPCPFCIETRESLQRGLVDGFLDGEWLEEGQEVSEADMSRVRCDNRCDGTSWESEAPEVNVSNDTARRLFRLLQLPWDQCGVIEASTLLQRVMVALHTDRSTEVTPATDLAGGHITQIEMVDGMPTFQQKGARWVDPGMSDDRLTRHLRNLRRLAEKSVEEARGQIIWG